MNKQRKMLRERLLRSEILVLPGVYDALTAKIAAEKAVKALFTGALLGKNLYRSAISSAIFATGLVENVAPLQPQADIPAAAKTLCRLGALTITEADA